MAGDWIKMRVWLRRDPRIASMADFLAGYRPFINWLTDPVRRDVDNAHHHITSDVTRAITVCALLEIWGVARDRGDRDGDDLVLKHCTLNSLDDICGVPGIGEALDYVNWATEQTFQDKKDRPVPSVRLPNFFRENESPEDRYRKQHAEAQARYRAKKEGKSDIASDAASDITRDITVTPREEKRREEETPQSEFSVGFIRFWDAWPRSERKAAKGKCFTSWKKAKAESLADTIVAHVESLKRTAGWTKDGGQYIPAPLVYLNERRWEGADSAHDDDPYGLRNAL